MILKLCIFRKWDESRKYVHDPLTSIIKQSAAHPPVSTSSSSKAPYRLPLPSKANHDKPPEVQARLSRESTERERALELIRRKQREMQGNATPSVFNDSGYGNVYNKRDVEEAHRFRDRRWDSRDCHWGDDDIRAAPNLNNIYHHHPVESAPANTSLIRLLRS